MKTVDTLHTKAADIAARGALDYIAARGYRHLVDFEALRRALVVHGTAAVGPALAEARAVWATMPRHAVSAFGLAMTLAGIAAAQEVINAANEGLVVS